MSHTRLVTHRASRCDSGVVPWMLTAQCVPLYDCCRLLFAVIFLVLNVFYFV